jgi:anti-sigma B factor antagonist
MSMIDAVQMPLEMDANSMRTWRPQFEELAAGPGDVTLDMSRVEFIDSSGVGAIVFLYKRLTATGRRLLLRGVSGQPLQLLTYLRLSHMIANSP